MTGITTFFFDLGGVVMTNGWDRATRRRAVERFHLDGDEFEDRHELLANDFEIGRISLDHYLERTVFYRERPFSRDEFREFLFAQSHVYPEALAVVGALARAGKYLLAALNNESEELNRHRIEKARLRDYFIAFLSSCYLGVRKPDEKIYRLALGITQREAAESLFVDDRALNVESAERLGMRAIRYESPAQLREALRKYAIDV
ncbi:MAG: HAD family phosphatase [Acidobacteria bacterium]|nr:HAD family phosphatase [Acidobacteriota bacterium]